VAFSVHFSIRIPYTFLTLTYHTVGKKLRFGFYHKNNYNSVQNAHTYIIAAFVMPSISPYSQTQSNYILALYLSLYLHRSLILLLYLYKYQLCIPALA